MIDNSVDGCTQAYPGGFWQDASERPAFEGRDDEYGCPAMGKKRSTAGAQPETAWGLGDVEYLPEIKSIDLPPWQADWLFSLPLAEQDAAWQVLLQQRRRDPACQYKGLELPSYPAGSRTQLQSIVSNLKPARGEDLERDVHLLAAEFLERARRSVESGLFTDTVKEYRAIASALGQAVNRIGNLSETATQGLWLWGSNSLGPIGQEYPPDHPQSLIQSLRSDGTQRDINPLVQLKLFVERAAETIHSTFNRPGPGQTEDRMFGEPLKWLAFKCASLIVDMLGPEQVATTSGGILNRTIVGTIEYAVGCSGIELDRTEDHASKAAKWFRDKDRLEHEIGLAKQDQSNTIESFSNARASFLYHEGQIERSASIIDELDQKVSELTARYEKKMKEAEPTARRVPQARPQQGGKWVREF